MADECADDIEDFNAVTDLMSTLLRSVTTLVKQSTVGCVVQKIVSLPRSALRILTEFYKNFPADQQKPFDEGITMILGQNAIRMQTHLLMLLMLNSSTKQGDSTGINESKN